MKLALHGKPSIDPFLTQKQAPIRILFDRIWWSKGMHCVELGCEQGTRTVDLHERLRSASCIGVDNDPESIRIAKARQTRDLRFVEADPSTWTPDQPVDLILLDTPKLARDAFAEKIARLSNWLSSEGQILVHSPRTRAHPLAAKAWTLAQSDRYPELFVTEEVPSESLETLEVSTILTECGFQKQQVEEHVLVHQFGSTDRVRDWILEFSLPNLRTDPDEDLSMAFAAELRQMVEDFGWGRPPLYWPTAHVIAWAKLPRGPKIS